VSDLPESVTPIYGGRGLMSKTVRGVVRESGDRRMRPKRLPVLLVSVLSVAMASTVGALVSLTPAAATSATWSIVPSPNPGTTGNTLVSISCPSASACFAVGYSSNANLIEQTLIEEWNGTAWSIVPSPNASATESDGLAAVTCISTTACTAVGNLSATSANETLITQTLIEQWNGTTWSIVPSPSPTANAGTLDAVWCTSSTACIAVGKAYPKALIEQWNGTSWSIVPSPNTGTNNQGAGTALSGVSCTSASACIAVGYSGNLDAQTLVEQWNGTAWSIVPSPDLVGGASPTENNYLNAISCTSASACTAVGFAADSAIDGPTLVEQWNGTSWSIQPSPSPVVGSDLSNLDELNGVSCTSASACTAVGSFSSTANPMRGPYTQGNLIEQWNGTAWSVVPVPAGSPALYGDACLSDSACTAVGFIAGTGNNSSTLVETSAPGAYTYAVPAVTGVSPNSGSPAGGTSVTVTGTGFTGATSVTFNGTPAAHMVVMNDSTITAISPSSPTVGTFDVVVTNPVGTSATSSADQFTYIYPTPVITSVAPNSGPTSGIPLEITGSGFTGATSVTIDGTPATYVTVYNDSQLSVVTPVLPAGTFDVLVTTPGGTNATSSADQFTALSTPAPVVSGVTPNSGPTSGGTTVTVTGTGFTGATSVSFNGTPGTNVVVASDSKITVTSPAQVAGSANVRVSTPFGLSAVVSADQFTYVANLPTVTSISPTSGPSSGGTSVTIKGSNFNGATKVVFGTVPAASFSVSSSTRISAVAPAGAAGSVDVFVTTPSATSAATSADQFTYVVTLPSVTSISPTNGPTGGGTSVSIKGTNLSGATNVLFGTVPASSFSVSSSTRITAVAPPGVVGSVDVLVVTPSATSAAVSADQFTYVLTLPSVTSISPTSGPTTGGTTVTIRGNNLTGATNVLFGTVPATSFTVVSSTKITAVSPAGASGSVDVFVTTPSGTSAATSADQFTYTKNRGH
jgi:large repetitive protein